MWKQDKSQAMEKNPTLVCHATAVRMTIGVPGSGRRRRDKLRIFSQSVSERLPSGQ